MGGLLHLFVFLIIGASASMAGLLVGLAPQIWRRFTALSQCAIISYSVPVVFCATIALIVVWRLGFPLPEVQDEFSYLLAAKTFSAGHLTNSAHPLWKHFETFHVNQVPTHNSMYQPAQGLVLAAGDVLFGHPWFGVLMSAIALALAAMWALRQWFSPRWALVAVLMMMSGLATSYWVFSYWGGCVPAIGGALVFGAIGSLRRSPSLAGGIALGSGVIVMLLSRPYEGLAFCAAAAICVALLLWRRNAKPWQSEYRSYFAAAALIVLIGVSFQAVYSYLNTGSPWIAPYQVNLRRYMTRPMFSWQPRRVVHYNHPVMEQLYLALFRSNFTTAE